MPETQIEFFFEGMEVGYFEEPAPPVSAGRCRYMPYRGPGHYEMSVSLRAGKHPHCSYTHDGKGYSFTVLSCPEYGVLELADFGGEEKRT